MKPQIPWQTQWAKSLSSVVRGFKIGVVKFCKENRIDFSWQKSFYDHIVRDDAAYARIVQYIIDNPKNWRKDRNNLENLFM